VNIYPFFVTGKLYPLAQIANITVHPYFQFGGGIVHASRSGVDYYYGVEFTEDSETKLTYTLGGGIDFPVADQICLLANYRYLPVDFSDPLAGLKDYSGWQVTVGLAYTFHSIGN
jgi:opacity protein-like surface antigen